MIACEKKFVLVKQDHVPARVARNRNKNEVVIKCDCSTAVNYMFDSQVLRAIISVHDAFAGVTIGEPPMISDIILVCEKHFAHATHRVNSLHELCGEPRRVDQNISALRIRPNNQIAPSAETRFGIETAIVNILTNLLGKRVDADMCVVVLDGAN